MRAITVVLVVACLKVQTSAAIPVELTQFDPGSGVVGTKMDTYADGASTSFVPVSIPSTGQREAINGGTVSGASYSFTDTEFRVDFNQTHEGNTHAHLNGIIYFTPGIDADYLISGVFSLNGYPDIQFYVRLSDATTGEELFDNLQISRTTENEVLTLGENAGDQLNYGYGRLQGSLSGSLHQGHQYQLHSYATIGDASSFAPSSSAVGFYSISFASAVPEPATWASLISGLGLLGVVMAGRKRLL